MGILYSGPSRTLPGRKNRKQISRSDLPPGFVTLMEIRRFRPLGGFARLAVSPAWRFRPLGGFAHLAVSPTWRFRPLGGFIHGVTPCNRQSRTCTEIAFWRPSGSELHTQVGRFPDAKIAKKSPVVISEIRARGSSLAMKVVRRVLSTRGLLYSANRPSLRNST